MFTCNELRVLAFTPALRSASGRLRRVSIPEAFARAVPSSPSSRPCPSLIPFTPPWSLMATFPPFRDSFSVSPSASLSHLLHLSRSRSWIFVKSRRFARLQSFPAIFRPPLLRRATRMILRMTRFPEFFFSLFSSGWTNGGRSWR